MNKRTIFKISALFMGLILSLSPAISNQVSAQGSGKPYEVSGFADGETKKASTLKEAFDLVNGG